MPLVCVQLCPSAVVQAAEQTYSERRSDPLVIEDAASILYEEMLRELTTLSPVVEATNPLDGLASFDVRGLARLWHADESTWDGMRVAHAALTQLAAKNVWVRIGIGTTRIRARLLCAHAGPSGLHALDDDQAHAFVQSLLLTDPALGFKLSTAQTLSDIGIRSVADLLRLPEGTIADRFGPAEQAIYQQLTRTQDTPLERWIPPQRITASTRVDTISDVSILDAILRSLSKQIRDDLAQRGVATTQLRLRITYENDSVHSTQRTYWPPLSTESSLATAILRLRAESNAPAAVEHVEIQASTLQRPLAHQYSLLNSVVERKRERLAALIETHERMHGSSLLKRWYRDSLSDDQWVCVDGAVV